MKTNKELLDFYGVEIGKEYKITKQAEGYTSKYVNTIFEVVERNGKLFLTSKYGSIYVLYIDSLNYFDYEEFKPDILDEKEKEYLRAVIKPFRKRVLSVTKCKSRFTENEHINIKLAECDSCVLPYFAPGTMYKGMEAEKEYTLKDLKL